VTRDPSIRLSDILQSIEQIEAYTAGVSRKQFLEDRMIQDAVTRRLEVIGEAVKGLSKSERSRHPGIPWSSIAGTRDKLIHDYFRVDQELVWEMVQDHLPALREAVAELLASGTQDSDEAT
jgi:uncharacterized protein with HEPN domain